MVEIRIVSTIIIIIISSLVDEGVVNSEPQLIGKQVPRVL